MSTHSPQLTPHPDATGPAQTGRPRWAKGLLGLLLLASLAGCIPPPPPPPVPLPPPPPGPIGPRPLHP
jgi:hypothetical protein